MRTPRLLPIAAAQLCCAALVCRPAFAGMATSAWSDLWRTPDQQGQALLDAGQPAQAADRFHDPRRRAYADLQAGRYQQAAKLLAPFGDAQSEYNRGNALAKAGQLQAALAAYDAALKQAPGDKDIRHNRDLVERALRQQHQSAQSSSANGRQGSRSGSSQGQQSQSGSGAQQSGSAGKPSAGAGQTASNSSQAGSNRPGNSSAQGAGQGTPRQSGDPQTSGDYGSGTPKDTPGQVQRDAALAAKLAREQRQRGAGSGSQGQAPAADQRGTSPTGKADSDSLLAGGTQTPKQKPESERQLALDQWLRQIPDSPAGLLQRKFLIEHMIRQQGGEDPPESRQ